MITLHGALSPAEKALAQSPAGAAQVQEFHRQLFIDSADALRQEIKTNHRGRGARSDRGSRADFGHRGAGLHDRHDGAGVPARQRRTRGQLERERIRRVNHKKRRFCHVSSIEEESGVGCGRRDRWVSSPAESHGARYSRHERETGLRGRSPMFPSIVRRCGNESTPRPVRSPDGSSAICCAKGAGQMRTNKREKLVHRTTQSTRSRRGRQ